MKTPKTNWIKIFFGIFSAGKSQTESDLPAWFLEQVKKNREMWIYWHHPDLFTLFPGFFWDDLGKLLRETDHKIYIVYSPLVCSELGNNVFDELPKSLKKQIEILKSTEGINNRNDFFIGGNRTFVTGLKNGTGANFNSWLVNQKCRQVMKELISAASPAGKKIETRQAVFN